MKLPYKNLLIAADIEKFLYFRTKTEVDIITYLFVIIPLILNTEFTWEVQYIHGY